MKTQEFDAFLIERISTNLEWDDLVLNRNTMDRVKEIDVWLKHDDSVLNDLGLKTSKASGFKVFFSGPSGTGKTLTASLLGKYSGREVYKINLSSLLTSKYIGETEKNLSELFKRARRLNWILFFDEADALFGKRTNIKDAHDKYANQRILSLMQSIENYPGLVILATNVNVDINKTFLRRFKLVVPFEVPNAKERLKLWQANFPMTSVLDKGLELKELAEKYELTGGSISNAICSSYLKSLKENRNIIKKKDIIDAIKNEYILEGKALTY